MKNLWQQLWQDDHGAIIAAEYLFLASILVTGVVVGFVSIRTAVNNEMSELANSYLALSQAYTIPGVTCCGAEVEGTAIEDTYIPGDEPYHQQPANPVNIDNMPIFFPGVAPQAQQQGNEEKQDEVK